MTSADSAAGYAPDFVAAVLDFALATPGSRPPVFGLAGLQGTGKSTLAAQLATHGRERGLAIVGFSIDDFYLGRRERLRLARQVHPLLATRGPPGTHDVALACATLDALKRLKRGQSEFRTRSQSVYAGSSRAKIHSDPFSDPPVRIPRFDKIGDRRLPPSRWTRVRQRPDLIVFEGWFLKVPPQSARELVAPLNPLERDEDADGVWRGWCNAALVDYAPLWARIGRLLFLQGPGFEIVPDWRWQQERTLQTVNPDRRTMTRAQVLRFVQCFERVSRQALRTVPAIADRTIHLDARREPQRWNL